MSLVVGHYRHLHLLAPSEEAVRVFVKGNFTIGSPKQRTKAILQNCALRNDIGGTPFLQRRLHLWFEIKPEKIDAEDPWAEEPPLDPYTFTLPTRSGAVAPARWKTHLRHREGRTYEGETCDFMELVYFRQEVLMKYQGSSGFDIKDDGSVRYRGYWGLDRSTYRIGNAAPRHLHWRLCRRRTLRRVATLEAVRRGPLARMHHRRCFTSRSTLGPTPNEPVMWENVAIRVPSSLPPAKMRLSERQLTTIEFLERATLRRL